MLVLLKRFLQGAAIALILFVVLILANRLLLWAFDVPSIY